MGMITTYRDRDFAEGYNDYTPLVEETGIRFQILVLAGDRTETISSADLETAILVIEGKGSLSINGQTEAFDRANWIDQNPVVAHLPAGAQATITTTARSRFAVITTANDQHFDGKIYTTSDIDVEHRGKDILDGTCYRLVRLAFDGTIAPPTARLVLGEVLNFPGKWSSYPPHHHEQAEVYYYEFSGREGYGHGELGDDVYKIKHQDILKITHARDHSQVAAPGYYMYYIWVIRHMDGAPYAGFEYTKPYDQLLQ